MKHPDLTETTVHHARSGNFTDHEFPCHIGIIDGKLPAKPPDSCWQICPIRKIMLAPAPPVLLANAL